ncbi:class I SAM-dependent methyltransferase [Antarcticimicrobium luteum]|uniref:Class I SAM-dependent methyltransferase n=1 Tax=Antarcticimicrobium luteum TaxID=2547397 RepID=A0A4R5UT44_9RHOB|nr:class I SAM-dependent methyltransferase [Antarcticimicrobium luteum]TDK42211.1 class I SAM-dependent methyltransferase [Antarcticimicrobium luteum]
MSTADLPEMDKDAWKDRAKNEAQFWRHWVRSSGGKWPEDFENRTNPNAPLINEITTFLDDLGTDRNAPVEILDIGSGPLSILGYVSPEREARLTLIDPLADVYNQILDNAGVEGVPRPRTGFFETAPGALGENKFDIVWCRNSLDHSIDPLLGLHNLIAMCKVGGGIILRFHPNEAEGGGYEGLHQWNLDKRDDRMVLSQKGLMLDLTPLIEAQKILSFTQIIGADGQKGMVTVKLQKLRDPNLSQAVMRARAL